MTRTEQHILELFTIEPIWRTSELVKKGIHPKTLYKLRDQGTLQQLTRGLYALSDREPFSYPDLVVVARKVPLAVICLTSALVYHELTTQIPHRISIAIPKFYRAPKLAYPPLEVFRFSEASHDSGVMYPRLDGVDVPIYSAEKSIADVFKFRNRIGLDIAMEALKFYLRRSDRDINGLLKYAKICRVERILTNYLEALV